MKLLKDLLKINENRFDSDDKPVECEYCGWTGTMDEVSITQDPYTTDGTVTVCPKCNEAESMRDIK